MPGFRKDQELKLLGSLESLDCVFGQDISVEEKFEALKLLEPKQWMPDVTPKRCLCFAAGNWLAKWLQIVRKYVL